jgi:hypothetical protein
MLHSKSDDEKAEVRSKALLLGLMEFTSKPGEIIGHDYIAFKHNCALFLVADDAMSK